MVMSHKRLLNKNLFYTGVTRAKSVVHIFGNQKAIEYAVNNKNVAVRNSKNCIKIDLNIKSIGQKNTQCFFIISADKTNTAIFG